MRAGQTFLLTKLLMGQFLIAVGLGACSSKVELPAAAQGVWSQSGGDGDTLRLKLKLENSAKGATVSYATTGGELSERVRGEWFGPLVLEKADAGKWRFTIAPIETTEGQTTNRLDPPQVMMNPKLGVDQNGRVIMLSYIGLKKNGEVFLQLDGDSLQAEGLWARMETIKVGSDGKPEEKKVTPLTTKFTRPAAK